MSRKSDVMLGAGVSIMVISGVAPGIMWLWIWGAGMVVSIAAIHESGKVTSWTTTTNDREVVRLPDARATSSLKDRWNMTIAKWELIIDILKDGKTPANNGSGSCAFCKKYTRRCRHCPIANMGKMHIGCDHTPHVFYQQADMTGDYEGQLDAAREEVRFLRAVRARGRF